MKIGDRSPAPKGMNHEAVRFAQGRRKRAQRIANGAKVRSADERAAQIAIDASRAMEARMLDPVEQAKTYLRSKGYVPVYSESGKHFVGRSRVFRKDKDLLKFAREKGWGG